MNKQVINNRIIAINKRLEISGDAQEAFVELLKIKPINDVVQHSMAINHQISMNNDGKFFINRGKNLRKTDLDPNDVLPVMLDIENYLDIPKKQQVF